MPRCKHLNVVVEEEVTGVKQWQFQQGLIMTVNEGNGHLTGRIYIRCNDCEREWRFHNNRTPEWVKERLSAIFDCAMGDSTF